MDDFPVSDLIFPCEYPLKVIGKNEDDFLPFVIELVSRHVPGLVEEAFTYRHSGKGTYLSVSVKFIASSREQVDSLYRELGQHPRVIIAL